MVSYPAQSEILQDFPTIKHSYENVIHKKVYSDIVVAIPKGKKYYAWFTKDYNTNNNVCYLLEIGPKRQIINVKPIVCCFDSELSYGTILYGTLFYQEDVRFFSTEDIFYYKDKFVSNQTWYQKLNILEIILSREIKQIAYNKQFVVFGCPIIHKTFEGLLDEINKIDYSIYSIQFRCYNKRNTYDTLNYLNICKLENDSSTLNDNKNIINKEEKENVMKTEPVNNIERQNTQQNTLGNQIKREKEKIFTIKADIRNDIYHLYESGNSTSGNYVGIAGICDYKTSVMMNNIYRIIKENKNLDSLEESDDEDEFENENEDRYVDLSKELQFICTYNYKFKRWCPVRMI